MSEFSHPHQHEAHQQASLETAQYLLDTTNIPPETDGYDERRALFSDVWQARQHLEDNMRRAAAEAGIAIDETAISNWQPDRATLHSLFRATEQARKRYRMVEGTLQFESDQAQLHQEYGVPLRDYQQATVRDFRNFLLYAPRSNEYGGKSGVIEMPTGTGKTGIFANIASMLKHGEHAQEPARVLVLVPSQTILEQTMGRKGDRGFGKFAPHLDVGAYYQHEKELHREVVVMTNASFNNLVESSEMPHFDAVIVDEAHMVLGDVTAGNLQVYGQDKIMVGLTATPEYDEQRSVYNLFQYKIHEMGFQEAVRLGRLAPVRGYLMDVEPQYNKYQLPADPAARERAKRQLQLQARILQADKIIEEELARGVGVIVRCPAGDDIDVAVQYAEYLRDKLVRDPSGYGMRWVTADYVGGSYRRQTIEDRNDIFQYYNKGETDVLTYVKAIGMGWDSPHAKVFINLAPTTSAVEMRQAIGRVMRLIKDPSGEPVEARVYDFRDPTLGDRQYTCLHALQTASGQLLAHDEEAPEPMIPAPRKYYHTQTPELYGADATMIDELALEHTVDAVMPDNVEVSTTLNAYIGDSIPQDEACRILGISLPTLKNILMNVGSSPDAPIRKDELEIIPELYPKLEAMDLPESGFISVRELAQMPATPVRMLSVIPFARRFNIHPYRFRDTTTGTVGFYFDIESAQTLLQLINEGKHRRLPDYTYRPPEQE
ncbi:MAG TPA: DEAD/DEAH box helicase family protein [Candidatus Saccharimonadales bacterium]|nr:DEAD/DEAH box helicase family protein [Candidatus Saccharimonadales bacterium]